MFTISFLYLVKGNRLCLNHFCRFWGIVEYDGNETTIESKGIIYIKHDFQVRYTISTATICEIQFKFKPSIAA